MWVVHKFLAILRWVKSYRAKPAIANTARTPDAEYLDRRSTPRVDVHIPLFVYGRTPKGDPFHEETCTISINRAGGLISMSSRVQPGQRLVVTNQGNDQTEQCIVVSVVRGSRNGSKIALKFHSPMTRFWRELEIGESPRHLG
jgi:hypothetical protein